MKSRIHKLLRTKLKTLDPEKIRFRMLTEHDLQEIKDLHSEWFPLSYQDKFFQRMFKNNVIAIGCFYPYEKEIDSRKKSKNAKKLDEKNEEEEIILGSIMTKVDN